MSILLLSKASRVRYTVTRHGPWLCILVKPVHPLSSSQPSRYQPHYLTLTSHISSIHFFNRLSNISARLTSSLFSYSSSSSSSFLSSSIISPHSSPTSLLVDLIYATTHRSVAHSLPRALSTFHSIGQSTDPL